MTTAKAARERAEFWQIHGDDIGAAARLIVRLVLATLERGGKLLFAGNGGSAADAQHLAAEYVGIGLPALALTTDSSVLTALGNDFGFDQVFAHQVRALGRRGDMLFLHSTSGSSPNILAAAQLALELEVDVCGLVAKGGGRFSEYFQGAGWAYRGTVAGYVVPTDSTSMAQEAHLAIGHIVFEAVRAELGR